MDVREYQEWAARISEPVPQSLIVASLAVKLQHRQGRVLQTMRGLGRVLRLVASIALAAGYTLDELMVLDMEGHER